MKHLYIFENKQSSSQCGLGTYMNEIVTLISQWTDVNLCFIMFQTEAKECMNCSCKGVDYILLPKVLSGTPFECDRSLIEHLIPFIEQEEECIFMYNYIPSDSLIRIVKDIFPLAKHLCVVHNFNWSTDLLGDDRKLRKIFIKEQMQFKLVDRVVCLSEDAQKILQKTYRIPKGKIVLIPNACVQKEGLSPKARLACRRKYHLEVQEKIILTVGRIGWAKGSFAFLNAFKRILKKEPSCRWVIAGNLSNASSLLARAEEAVSRITLTGHIDEKRLAHWYQMADIGVCASYTEQCSYAGLEMMAYGLPVVASDGLGVRCMFQNGVNAHVARIGCRDNPKDFERHLAECVLSLWNDTEEKEKLKKNGFRILCERYAPNQVEKQYRDLFNDL